MNILTLSTHLQLRAMKLHDIPMAMRLKTMANWNQVEADWELFLTASSQGNFVALYDGKEVGTVTTLTYPEKFSWIGMVLVDPAYRGLGIGTALLQVAIISAKTKGTIRLDATLQGKKLYQTLGFQVEHDLVRMERKQISALPDPVSKCRILDNWAFKKILEIDRTIFGADRQTVLRYLWDTAPPYACYTEIDGRITGYCFGRPGSNFEHIGPIVSENHTNARDLLVSAIRVNPSKPFIVDIPARTDQWIEELDAVGFTIQRPFIRMYLGALANAGNMHMSYAIAGPELG